MMRNIAMIILDLDGVITDTAHIHEKAWKQVFESLWSELGHPEKKFTHEEYKLFLDGKPREDGIKDYLSYKNIDLPLMDYGFQKALNLKKICIKKNQIFEKELSVSQIKVFDDAKYMITRWEQNGIKLALVSSSRHCRSIIDNVGLAKKFDVIVSGLEKKN